jgi:multicomponent Na+:H+ antiporter subunit G
MDTIVVILSIIGMLFFFATTVGLLRFPDFYSRMHAAGKGDTLSSLLLLGALILHNFHELNLANLLVAGKILLIVVFIFMASPTATHAIIDAGYESGIKPWQKEKSEEENYDDLAT